MVRIKPLFRPDDHHGHPEGHRFEFDEKGRMHVEALRVPKPMVTRLRVFLGLIIAASLWNLYDLVDMWTTMDDVHLRLEEFFIAEADAFPHEFIERDAVRLLDAFLTWTAWLLTVAMIVLPIRYAWLFYRVPYGHPRQYNAMLGWAWVIIGIDVVRLLLQIAVWTQDFELYQPGFFIPFNMAFGIVMLSMLYRRDMRFHYGAFRVSPVPLQAQA